MEMPRFNLSPEQKEQVKARLQEILKPREDVLFAYLHGSFLLNVPFEDIDVAVYLRQDPSSSEEWLQTAFHLADMIERQVRLPVDVQVLNAAPRGVQFNCYSVGTRSFAATSSRGSGGKSWTSIIMPDRC